MELTKPRIYIDMDGVLCDFAKGVQDGKKLFPHITYQQSRVGFFANLEPIDGSIETVKWLNEHFEIFFLTRPSYMNLMCYTEKALWIQTHFGQEYLPKLMFAGDKSVVKGDYLIDDSIMDGQDKFDGVLIRFSINPYFSTWADVRKYFEELI